MGVHGSILGGIEDTVCQQPDLDFLQSQTDEISPNSGDLPFSFASPRKRYKSQPGKGSGPVCT